MIHNKVIKAGLWSAIERFSVQGISFFVQLILARMLMPEDYGLIGMLLVFISIAQSFIDSGFSTALIQKKDSDNLDLSTVFHFNCFISILLYIILFFSAPLISDFYNQPLLNNLLRILGLTLIINSLSIVQRTILIKNIDFKTQSKASFSAALISGIIAIILAYKGLGVWSLVFQNLLSSTLNSILLNFYSQWKPQLIFSYNRLKQLFSFGVNILFSGLIYTLYNQLYVLIIGKRFSSTDLGNYSRAEQFYQFPSSNICEILKRVYFPWLCNIQNNYEELLKKYRLSLQLSVLIIFPLMLCLSVIAEPTIKIILTDKWISVAWMLQLLCFRGMIFPLTTLNLNILNVIGKSNIFFKAQFITHIVAIVLVLAISFFANITILLICQIFIVYLMLGISSYYVSKYFPYNLWDLLKDVKGAFICSIVSGIIAYSAVLFLINPYLQLFLGGSIYFIIYLSSAYLFNASNFRTIKLLIRQ